jgi:hypothetical protein
MNPTSSSTTENSRSLLQIFSYLAVAIALIALWAFAMPRFVRSAARRRENNLILLSWRSAVAQFEAVHGELPNQLTVFEIGERFIEQNWGQAEFVGRIVNLVTQHLFAGFESNIDVHQELDDLVTTYRAQLPLNIQIRQRLSPRLAWKLAGGRQSRP